MTQSGEYLHGNLIVVPYHAGVPGGREYVRPTTVVDCCGVISLLRPRP